MPKIMVRKSFTINEYQARRLREIAGEERKSESELIREAIQYLLRMLKEEGKNGQG